MVSERSHNIEQLLSPLGSHSMLPNLQTQAQVFFTIANASPVFLLPKLSLCPQVLNRNPDTDF